MNQEQDTNRKRISIIIGIIIVIIIILLLIKACTKEGSGISFADVYGSKEILYLEYGDLFDPNIIKIYENGKVSSKKPTIDDSAVDYTKLGTYIIKVSYVDSKGKTYTDQRTLIIKDTKGPVITLKGDNPLSVRQKTPYVEPGYEVYDNYDRPEDIKVVIQGKVDTNFLESYVLTYIATDSSGNKSSVTRTVMVETKTSTTTSTTKPKKVGVTTLTLKGQSTMYLDFLTTYKEPGYTATDTVDGNITSKVIATGKVNIARLGTYPITYSVTNSGGKKTTVTRTVIVSDKTAPVIKINGANPLYVELGSVYIDLGASAVDNYDGVVSVYAVGSVDTSTLGKYQVTYSAVDSSGNRAEVTRTVHVVNSLIPVITIAQPTGHVLPGTTIANAVNYLMTGVSAIDRYDNDLTNKIYFEIEFFTGDELATMTCYQTNPAPCNAWFRSDIEGAYTITYRVKDVDGNSAIPKTKTVNIIEDPKGYSSYSTILPTKDNVTATIATNKIIDPIPGWTKVDNYTYTKEYSANYVGEVEICYTPIDEERCSYVNITILNIDKTPISASVSYSTTNQTNYDVVATITTNKLIDTPAGWLKIDDTHYQKTYTANTVTPEIVALSDEVGHTGSVTVSVNNIDRVPPVIALIGDAVVYVEAFEDFDDPGATAIDDVDGVLSVTIYTDLVSSIPKTYHITYLARDRAGNYATVTRVVIVELAQYVVVLSPDVYLKNEPMGNLTVLRTFQGVTEEFFDFTHNFDSSTVGNKTLQIMHDGRVIRSTPYYVVSSMSDQAFLRVIGPTDNKLRVEFYSHSANFTVVYYYSPVLLKDPANGIKSLTPVTVSLPYGIPGYQANKNKWGELDITGWPDGYYYFAAGESAGKNDAIKLFVLIS